MKAKLGGSGKPKPSIEEKIPSGADFGLNSRSSDSLPVISMAETTAGINTTAIESGRDVPSHSREAMLKAYAGKLKRSFNVVECCGDDI